MHWVGENQTEWKAGIKHELVKAGHQGESLPTPLIFLILIKDEAPKSSMWFRFSIDHCAMSLLLPLILIYSLIGSHYTRRGLQIFISWDLLRIKWRFFFQQCWLPFVYNEGENSKPGGGGRYSFVDGHLSRDRRFCSTAHCLGQEQVEYQKGCPCCKPEV